MNKRYNLKEIINDRWAIWYIQFPKRKGNRIGCYKIIDLYKPVRTYKYAFRYKPREGQTQEQSDNAIIMNCIRGFYRPKVYIGNRIERGNTNLKTA